MHEFIDLAALGIGSSGASSKNDVSDGINARVGVVGINELPVPTTLLPNEELDDILICVKALGEVARIGSDSARCGSELRVSTRRKIDWKREFFGRRQRGCGKCQYPKQDRSSKHKSKEGWLRE